MKKKNNTLFIVLAVIAVVAVVLIILSNRKVADFHNKYEGVDLTKEVVGTERKGTYDKYVRSHPGAAQPAKDTVVDIYNYTAEGDVSIENGYHGEDKALLTQVNSKVTWNVDVPEAGFYNLYMDYLAEESRGVAVERSVKINGETPFDDAVSIEFTRMWKDGGPVKVDNQRNEIRPTQVEEYDWQSSLVKPQ